MLTTMALSPGDIVILGTDGLWDNVSEEELLEEVEKNVMEGAQPSVIAQRLAFQAFESSQDKVKQTPYRWVVQAGVGGEGWLSGTFGLVKQPGQGQTDDTGG